MSMKQSDSVIFFTKLVLGEAFQPGVAVTSYVSKDERSQIVDQVTKSIATFETDMKEESRVKYADPKALRGYVTGMVKNWFDKSKVLNGDVKHAYKNPGSRAGQGDAQLKALKTLRSQLKDEADIARVDAAIELRATQIAAEKPKATINVEALPEELRHLIAG